MWCPRSICRSSMGLMTELLIGGKLFETICKERGTELETAMDMRHKMFSTVVSMLSVSTQVYTWEFGGKFSRRSSSEAMAAAHVWRSSSCSRFLAQPI